MKTTIQALAAVSAGTLATAKAMSSSSSSGGEITHRAGAANALSQQHAMAHSEKTQTRKLQAACSNCHVADGNAIGGPDIFNGKTCIFDKPAGTSDTTFAYSQALQESGITWNETTLDQWLENPQSVVNGTQMMFQGISDPMERRMVIDELRQACGVAASDTTSTNTNGGDNGNDEQKEEGEEGDPSSSSNDNMDPNRFASSGATDQNFSMINLSLLTAGLVFFVHGRK